MISYSARALEGRLSEAAEVGNQPKLRDLHLRVASSGNSLANLLSHHNHLKNPRMVFMQRTIPSSEDTMNCVCLMVLEDA